MKKIIFLIIAILITLIKSQNEKETERKIPKMVCKLKNRSYELCYWYTRNVCCNKNPYCPMSKKMGKCERIFHYSKDYDAQNRIKKELEEERKKYHNK